MESVASRLEDIKTQHQPRSNLLEDFASTNNKRFEAKLTEDDINILKPLVKDIPILCDLPVSYRADVLKLVSGFIELEKDDSLLSIQEKNPNIYILYKGKLKFSKYSVNDQDKEYEETRRSDLFYIKENFKEISPVFTFGSIDAITSRTEDKWKPAHVYAIKDSSLVVINSSELRSKIKDIMDQDEAAEAHDFLIENIKGLDNIIASNRNKIINSFKKKEYPLPKMQIIVEGEYPEDKSKICIIKSGECKVFSK